MDGCFFKLGIGAFLEVVVEVEGLDVNVVDLDLSLLLSFPPEFELPETVVREVDEVGSWVLGSADRLGLVDSVCSGSFGVTDCECETPFDS